MIKNSVSSYGSVAKLLHWLIFLMVVIMIFVGYFMDDIKNEALKDQVFNMHKISGLTVLCLMILRLLWAIVNVKPKLPAGTPRWQHAAEHIVHGLLYLFLIAMPLAGWVGSVSAGYAPHFFQWNIALPIAKNKQLSDFCFSVHDTVAVLIIIVVSLHAVAAVYHHVVKKDDVLRRMLP